jgi:hypothetical protein
MAPQRGKLDFNSVMNTFTALSTARIRKAANYTNKQLKSLNETNSKMLEVQKGIEEKQNSIARLSEEQAKLQTQSLDVAKQQLILQQISAAQLQIQTEMQKESELRRLRQKQLKDAAYSLKQEILAVVNKKEFSKYVHLFKLKTEAATTNLNPAEVDEIADKEYVREVLDKLDIEFEQTYTLISDLEKELLEKYIDIEKNIAQLTSNLNDIKNQQINSSIKSSSAISEPISPAPLPLKILYLIGLMYLYIFYVIFVVLKFIPPLRKAFVKISEICKKGIDWLTIHVFPSKKQVNIDSVSNSFQSEELEKNKSHIESELKILMNEKDSLVKDCPDLGLLF